MDIRARGGTNWPAMVITRGSVPWFGACPWDLPSSLVHTPALPDAVVTLHGGVRSILLTGGDVLSHRRARTPWTRVEAVSVLLTWGFLPLWGALEAVSIVTGVTLTAEGALSVVAASVRVASAELTLIHILTDRTISNKSLQTGADIS